jgi:hypothetical protein
VRDAMSWERFGDRMLEVFREDQSDVASAA